MISIIQQLKQRVAETHFRYPPETRVGHRKKIEAILYQVGRGRDPLGHLHIMHS